jgi:hypothetical protein
LAESSEVDHISEKTDFLKYLAAVVTTKNEVCAEAEAGIAARIGCYFTL